MMVRPIDALLIDFVRYATPDVCPGQANAESAAVRKIRMRGMKIPTRPRKLVLSFICIKTIPP
jgi:hypothetical protein